MRRHITYANVMATLALFFALGGGAYAATKLPKNSVSSTQIKNSSITGSDIKNNTIKGADVDEAALAQVPSAKRAETATSAATATSATRAATAASATKATTADSATKAATADSATTATTAANADKVGGLDPAVFKLRCPAGTRPKWGACLELAAHDPATPLAAIEDCSSRGGTLPTYAQLAWVRSQNDITWAQGSGGNQYEMTSERGATKDTVLSISKTDNELDVTLDSASQRYRCVLDQVNG
jgi:hypothetical protein